MVDAPLTIVPISVPATSEELALRLLVEKSSEDLTFRPA
jgi:hypothetical protein